MKKINKRNGFTLIELLAVLIVLAVIALITTPLVMNIIENARKKAFENSVYGIMETYRLDMAKNLNNIGKSHTFPEANNDLKYNGKEMVGGSIFLDYEDDVEVRRITDGRYCADGNRRNLKVKKGDCQIDMATAPILNFTTMQYTDFLHVVDKTVIESIEFVMVEDFPKGAIDVSAKRNGSVMAWTKDEDSNGLYEVYVGAINDVIYANPNSGSLFYGTKNLRKLDLRNFDTITATDMHGMFQDAGYSSLDFTLNLGNKFDTSNVTNMYSMFQNVGYSSPSFTLKLGNKFDTSKVTRMNNMFYNTGSKASDFTIVLGSKFDTSNVTDMNQMFHGMGSNSSKFTLDLGDKFDTSKVINMSTMFYNTGFRSKNFILDLGNKFNVDKVTNVNSSFYYTGYSTPNFKPTAQVKTQAEKDAILSKFPNIDVTIVP